MAGLLGRVISPSQGLYLRRTTQHRKTLANIYALSGIRTHDPSNQPAKTHASDRTATVTGIKERYHTEERKPLIKSTKFISLQTNTCLVGDNSGSHSGAAMKTSSLT
jgi:hypothetical protein